MGTYRDPVPADLSIPDTVQLRQVDLQDPVAVERLVSSCRPDVVQHLAAQSSAAQSWHDPMGTLLCNSSIQYNLLEALRHNVPDVRIVVIGSCDEYGTVSVADNPVNEDQELRPANPYALSKVTQDLMGRQYWEVYGLHVIRLRPFLQIGPRRSEQFVAGSFAKQVAEIQLERREAVIDVGTIDLARDFTDVRDVARAFELAVDRCRPGDVYNVASGESHTLADLLNLFLRTAGVEATIRPRADLMREGEAPVLVGNASKFRTVTGWAPEISFQQSVEDTLTYWCERVSSRLLTEGTKS